MTDRELRQMLEAMRIPMMIADGSGGVLMENMAWVDLRKTLQDGFDAELKNAVLQAESTGTEQILKISRQKLLVTPLSGRYPLFWRQALYLSRLFGSRPDTRRRLSPPCFGL